MIKIKPGTSGRITVVFPYNPDYITKIKTIKGHRWHPEEKHWSFPYSNRFLREILSAFTGEELDIDPSLQALTSQGQERKLTNDTTRAKDLLPTEPRKTRIEDPGSGSNFEDLRKELVLRKYSPKTIKAYIHYNKDLLKIVSKSSADITNEDIKNYLLYLVEERGVSTSTLNSAINALKFYYGTILKQKFFYEIKRPRKDKKLPVVLNRGEVSKILSAPSNIKHKAILMLIYSAGLRVGEAVRLRVEDIDQERKLIHIKGAKGRKDRYTLLSAVALAALKKYYLGYQPKRWLFPGQKEERHITIRTVEKILKLPVSQTELGRRLVSIASAIALPLIYWKAG